MALPKLTKEEAVELATAVSEELDRIIRNMDFCCSEDAVDAAQDNLEAAVLNVFGYGDSGE